MKSPKSPETLTSAQFSKVLPEYAEYAERIRKTLYYGRLPATDRPSLPFTSMSVEKFSELCRQDGLEHLDMRYASSVCYDACVTPCSLIMALVYLERLRKNNPEYLATTSPAQVFLVAMMVASKYLYDDGEEDEVFNDEWATSAALPLADLNQAEREFLIAIEWELFVGGDDFVRAFGDIESKVAQREGEKRGFFTYTDLIAMSQTLPLSCPSAAFLTLIHQVFSVCLVGYTAAMMSVLAGTFLAQQCSQQLSATLHSILEPTLTNQSIPCSPDTLFSMQHTANSPLLQAIADKFVIADATENAENYENVNASMKSHILTTLTASILLAVSVSSPSSPPTNLDDPTDSYNSASDIPDVPELDPASLRLPFTTGSYWLPSTRTLDFIDPVLSVLTKFHINSFNKKYDKSNDTAIPSLWDMPWSPPVYGYIYNNSGIDAANVVSGDFGVGNRENGLVEWLVWAYRLIHKCLQDLVPSTQE
ncbi:unnamed protein product, partial [Meganyctiphanes norvegica]